MPPLCRVARVLAHVALFLIALFVLTLEVWPESHLPGFALRKTDVFQSDMT